MYPKLLKRHTKEIVISKINGSSVMAKIITAEEIAEMYEVVYKKIYELLSSVEDWFFNKKDLQKQKIIFFRKSKKNASAFFFTLKLCTYDDFT